MEISIYFYKLLYIFQAVCPPVIRSTNLYIERQVLSNQYCYLLLSWMRWNFLFISINFSTCFRRFLRPSSGAQTVHTASGIVKPIPLPAFIVDEMEISIYFYKLLYIFQAVSPPVIRSTKLYIERQVLSNQYCYLLLSWMR